MLTLLLAPLAACQFSDPLPITAALPAHRALETVDIDGDGALDLVVASGLLDDPPLAWYRQLPDGTFARPVPIGAGAVAIVSVDAADLDGDAIQDLVLVSDISTSRVIVVLGLGGGAFAPANEIGTVAQAARDIEVVDIDADGDVDVLIPDVGIPDRPAALFTNLGGGAFAPKRPLVDAPLNALLTFDSDGDGDLDLVAAERARIVALRNDGPAGFVEVSEIAPQVLIDRLRFADLDGDGRDDLVAVESGSTPLLRTFRSTGGFGFVPTGEVPSGLTRIADLGVVDVDRDGTDDVVVASKSLDDLVWLESAAGATLLSPAPLTPGEASTAEELSIADLDGDGFPDITLARATRSLATLPGAPTASGPAFANELRELTGRLRRVADVVAIDVDGDGDRDILGASPTRGLTLARSIAGEEFLVPAPILPAIESAERLVRADVDGDGAEDVVLVDRDARLVLLWNEPTGDLASEVVDGTSLDLVGEVVVGDLEGDGDLDLFGVAGPSTVVVYEQIAPRAFAPRRTAAQSADDLREVVAVDADADGDLDLVVLEDAAPSMGQVRTSLRLFEGDGSGTFTDAGILIEAETFAVELHALRIASEPRPAFVWGAPFAVAVDIARPEPSGGWDRPQNRTLAAAQPVRIVVGDVSGSGSDEVIVQSLFGLEDSLEVFRLLSSGVLLVSESLESDTTKTADMDLVDLDGDFDLDLVTLDPTPGDIFRRSNRTLRDVGSSYCGPAVPNRTGRPARLSSAGSDVLAVDQLTLFARDLPPGATALFLVSTATDLVPMAGGGAGTLCLGGSIGRFLGPGAVQPATGDGLATLDLDLTSFPSPIGPVTPTPGSLWFFQTWYRDLSGGVPTSNLTDGLAVVFR